MYNKRNDLIALIIAFVYNSEDASFGANVEPEDTRVFSS